MMTTRKGRQVRTTRAGVVSIRMEWNMRRSKWIECGRVSKVGSLWASSHDEKWLRSTKRQAAIACAEAWERAKLDKPDDRTIAGRYRVADPFPVAKTEIQNDEEDAREYADRIASHMSAGTWQLVYDAFLEGRRTARS